MSEKFLLFIFAQILINFLLFFNIDKISSKINILDIPNHRKVHKESVPLLGGIFFFINLIFFYFYDVTFFKQIFFYELHLYDLKQNIIFIFTIFIIFLLGILDDKFNVSYEKKFFVLIIILYLNISIDTGLQIKNLSFSFHSFEFEFISTSIFFTLFCFILYMNAINMFDGINLQTCFTIIPIYTFFLCNGKLIYFSIFIIIFLLFFTLKNYNGKIFLGDSGSLLLSYITAFFLVKNHNIVTLNHIEYSDYVVSFMFLPVLDLARQFLIRLSRGKNPFYPDDNHLHHRLIRKFNYSISLALIVSLSLLPILINFMSNFKYNIYCIILASLIYFFLIYITRSKVEIGKDF